MGIALKSMRWIGLFHIVREIGADGVDFGLSILLRGADLNL
jgi:hypothetical protein